MYILYVCTCTLIVHAANNAELACEPPTTPDSNKGLLCIKSNPDLLQEVYAGVMNLALHSLISDTSLSLTLLHKSPLEATVLLSCYAMTPCGFKLLQPIF